MKFRSDINGLRAIAVLSVLFYHFGVAGAGGGYVGVDVFFVISGYLMAQIILTKLDAGAFRLGGFYIARARRILPALTVMVAALLAGGWFYLPPLDYKLMGWQALSALTFVSNIVLSHRGDYFDAASHGQWLLHTWSLSVEWQFYMLFPLFLMGLKKIGRVREGVMAAFVLSLAAALATPLWPVEAFFLLPARAWELLAGALVFLYGGKIAKVPGLSAAGLTCIFFSVIFYSADLEFPGFWAALPVMGTALVIAARPKNALLDNRLAQFFGAISYSLYLWHWVVMVAAKYFDIPFTPASIFWLLGLTVLLASASYLFVERPCRDTKKKTLLAAGFGGSIALAAACGAVFFVNGAPLRLPATLRAVTQAQNEKPPLHGICAFDYKKGGVPPDCILGADKAPTAAIWGDSHAAALSTAMGGALIKAGRSSLLYSYAGCPPVLDALQVTKRKKDRCRNVNQITYDRILADRNVRDVFLVARWALYTHGYNEKGGPHPYVVFGDVKSADEGNIAQRTESYAKKMTETLCGLASKGKRVHVLAPVPEMGKNVPAAMEKAQLIDGRAAVVEIPRADYEKRNGLVLQALGGAAKKCGVEVLDPASRLCGKAVCSGVKDGRPLYADDNHLGVFGNDLMRPMFLMSLKRQ